MQKARVRSTGFAVFSGDLAVVSCSPGWQVISSSSFLCGGSSEM